jgi:hypothetical protein
MLTLYTFWVSCCSCGTRDLRLLPHHLWPVWNNAQYRSQVVHFLSQFIYHHYRIYQGTWLWIGLSSSPILTWLTTPFSSALNVRCFVHLGSILTLLLSFVSITYIAVSAICLCYRFTMRGWQWCSCFVWGLAMTWFFPCHSSVQFWQSHNSINHAVMFLFVTVYIFVHYARHSRSHLVSPSNLDSSYDIPFMLCIWCFLILKYLLYASVRHKYLNNIECTPFFPSTVIACSCEHTKDNPKPTWGDMWNRVITTSWGPKHQSSFLVYEV